MTKIVLFVSRKFMKALELFIGLFSLFFCELLDVKWKIFGKGKYFSLGNVKKMYLLDLKVKCLLNFYTNIFLKI